MGLPLLLPQLSFQAVFTSFPTSLVDLLIDGLGDNESTSSHLTEGMITLRLSSLLDAGVLAVIGPPLRRVASSISLTISL
jgi:hypothetical protein